MDGGSVSEGVSIGTKDRQKSKVQIMTRARIKNMFTNMKKKKHKITSTCTCMIFLSTYDWKMF